MASPAILTSSFFTSILERSVDLLVVAEESGSCLYRLYKKLNESTPGLGIGLYLVKTHVESLGGEIQVYSSPQKGTRFLIHLPA